MLKAEVRYLKKAEKELASFHQYSYRNYVKVISLIDNLKAFLNIPDLSYCKQDALELDFELNELSDTLNSLRYSTDKDEEFLSYVSHLLSIITRLTPYLKDSKALLMPTNSYFSIPYFLKRFSFVLKHAEL